MIPACQLRRNGLCVEGQVAWARGSFAGLAFTICLSPEVVMEHVARRAVRDGAQGQAVRHVVFGGELVATVPPPVLVLVNPQDIVNIASVAA